MNNKYFNRLTVVPALLMLLVLGSCKKYLDQQPITDLSSDAVFKDVASTYKAIAGVYSRLVGDAGYGIRMSLYYPVDNDEMQGPTGASDNDRRDIARYAATPGNAQITNPFNQLFQGIEFANICISNIPKMEMYTSGTDQQKKQLQRMYGEALTLRAQFYFEAIRNWGDLPAHFQPAADIHNANPFPFKTDRDSLYGVILTDLKTAEDFVPWRNDITSIGDVLDERITKGTIKGLRARIALFRGGYSLRSNGTMQRSANYLTFYQIAKDECTDIVNSGQHALNPSFKGLWKNQVCAHAVTDPQGELMFQASAIGLSGAEDTKVGYYDGPRVNGNGNSSINPLATYFYLFDSTDTRRDVTIAPYFVAVDGITKITPGSQALVSINDGKYRRDWITNPTIAPTNATQYLGLKWQILRYSDVLLMLAEAENEINGPTSIAYNAINMVRRRGFGKPISSPDPTVDIPAGLTKTTFFQYLVRERSLELGGEGIRKYDLIRWNLLATAITETRANLNRMAIATAMVAPTYMAPPPVYSMVNTLPQAMLLRTGTTADDATIWANSYYKPAPTSTPSGTTRLTWIALPTTAAPRNSVGTTSADRYATGFTSGKSELLPIPQPARDANFNLTQNPGY
jgi:hypothetical protein